MFDILNKIKLAAEKDLKNKNIFELLASATEELGELAQSIKVEEKTFGSKHKVLSESSMREAVDLIICSLAMFYARGGQTENLESLLNEKLKKWNKNNE